MARAARFPALVLGAALTALSPALSAAPSGVLGGVAGRPPALLTPLEGVGALKPVEAGFVDQMAWRSWLDGREDCQRSLCTWERSFGAGSDDKISAVVQTVSGDFIVAGNSRANSAGLYDAWVLRVSEAGALMWRRRFGGALSDQLSDLALAPDGGVYAVGHTRSRGAGESDLWLLRLDAGGARLWERTFGGARNDRGRALAMDGAGGVYVAGFTASGGAGDRDFWVLRIDQAGEERWSRRFGGPGYDDAFDIAATGDGVVATGQFKHQSERGGVDPGFDMAVVRLDAAGGLLWRRSFHRSRLDIGSAVTATAEGGALILGATSMDGLRDQDLWALALDRRGAVIWRRRFGGARVEEPWAVVALAGGGYAVAAQTYSYGQGGDAWLLRLGADGAPLWSNTYGGAQWDHPSALLEVTGGGLLIGGTTASKGGGFEDGWLLRLGPLGLR